MSAFQILEHDNSANVCIYLFEMQGSLNRNGCAAFPASKVVGL
jgi:hypothetical protein